MTAPVLTTTAAPARPARPVHVPAADAVRVLTFACVIAVHTVSTTNALDNPRADAIVMLLHFTREAFFVLTAFVLVHTHAGRELRVGPFWRRRFLLVGVPFLVWSVIYSALSLVVWDGSRLIVTPPDASTLLLDLVTGKAWYHLYFLLVSMQFYLLFPLFRRLLRATAAHPLVLLVAAAAAQVLVDVWVHDPAPTGWKALLLPYAGSFVGSYVFFLVLGGVLARHREWVLMALREHPVLVAAAFAMTGAGAEAWYLRSVDGGTDPITASDVFQPVMIPWAVAVVAAFALLGLFWARRTGRGPRWVAWASDRAFGVFLVHPVFLWALTVEGLSAPMLWLPQPWSGIACYVVAAGCSLGAVELMRRTPLRMPLTGKPSERRSG